MLSQGAGCTVPVWAQAIGEAFLVALLALPIAQLWWIFDTLRGPFRPRRFATIWVACVPAIAVTAAAYFFGQPTGGEEMVFYVLLCWIAVSAALCVLGMCLLLYAAAMAPPPRELAEGGKG